MKAQPGTKSRTLFLLLLGIVLLPRTGSASPGPTGCGVDCPPDVSTELQAALDRWAASERHHGVSAAVIMADGQEWVGSAGQGAAGQPLTPAHLIWMASITKTMTGAVILRLAEDGALELDDPISRWMDPPTNVDPDITIRQLLNHTNGLANYTRSPALGPAISGDREHVFTSDELLGFVGAKVFEPGERTQYSNTSFVLLGVIAESAGQKPIMDLYRERLWNPLGLEEIFLAGQSDPAGEVVDALTRGQIVSPMDRMSLLTIGNTAFGMFSNARTIARWGRALLGGDILGPAMQREMLEFVPAAGNIPGESGSGLGIRKYSYLDREQWGHSGGSPLGSSLMFYDPDSGVTVAVIMNQGGRADHFRLAPELLEIVTRSENSKE